MCAKWISRTDGGMNVSKRTCVMCDRELGPYERKYCPTCRGKAAKSYSRERSREETARIRAENLMFRGDIVKRPKPGSPRAQEPTLSARQCCYIDRTLGLGYGRAQAAGLHTAAQLDACRKLRAQKLRERKPTAREASEFLDFGTVTINK